MKKIVFLSLALVLVLAACNYIPNRDNALDTNLDDNTNLVVDDESSIDDDGVLGLANPASVNCQEKGGNLEIKKKADGGEYGVCYFEDNRQCEEWALFKGDCPVGGVKVTGYDSEEQIFCAIMGGEVLMDQNICKYKDGEYDINLFMNGKK